MTVLDWEGHRREPPPPSIHMGEGIAMVPICSPKAHCVHRIKDQDGAFSAANMEKHGKIGAFPLKGIKSGECHMCCRCRMVSIRIKNRLK